jgi:hypothetical protein
MMWFSSHRKEHRQCFFTAKDAKIEKVVETLFGFSHKKQIKGNFLLLYLRALGILCGSKQKEDPIPPSRYFCL